MEVLISVAVTAIGLLGIAGLLMVSSKVTESASMRTQVELAAQSLIDSMRTNSVATLAGDYEGTLSTAAMDSTDCAAQKCSAKARSAYERRRFARSLAAVSPDAKASVGCAASGTEQVCRLVVQLPERKLSYTNSVENRAMAWVFVP